MARIRTLTPEQKALFQRYVDKWTKIALSTEPADRQRAERAIRGLYALAKLKEPRVIWLPCPISAAMSATIYANLRRLDQFQRNCSALDNVVAGAVGGAVGEAVQETIRSAVGNAVARTVDSAVYNAVGSAIDRAVVTAAGGAATSYFGGSVWSAGYSAWADYFNEVLGISIDRNYLDLTESCGFYWMLDDICFAGERPSTINLNRQGQLHCDKSESIAYSSGWRLWHINGVQVPQYVVERPHEITAEIIRTETNAAIRRVMIQRYEHGGENSDLGAQFCSQEPNGPTVDNQWLALRQCAGRAVS